MLIHDCLVGIRHYCLAVLGSSGLMAVLLSCGSPEQDIRNDQLEIIIVPEMPEREIEFQRFVEKVGIFPLETSPESLFTSVFDFIYQNNKFYVYDMWMQKLFVFSKEGKFLFELNKKGKGPEEYLEMRDVEVNDQGDVYVLSYKKILVYDSLIRLKKTIRLSFPEEHPVNPTMFALAFDSGYYLYAGAFGLRGETPGRYSIYKVDSTGTFRGDLFFPVRNNGAESPRFFKLAGRETYTLTPILGNDTIYKFTADKVFPAYFLDYGDRKLPTKLYLGFGLSKELYEAGNTTDLVTNTYSIIESSIFMSYSFQASQNKWIVFYSKESGQSFCFPASGEYGTAGYFPRIRSGVGRQFYGHIDSHLLMASKESGEFKRKFGYLKNYDSLEAIIDGLDENDNPAIMVVTLKDF